MTSVTGYTEAAASGRGARCEVSTPFISSASPFPAVREAQVHQNVRMYSSSNMDASRVIPWEMSDRSSLRHVFRPSRQGLRAAASSVAAKSVGSKRWRSYGRGARSARPSRRSTRRSARCQSPDGQIVAPRATESVRMKMIGLPPTLPAWTPRVSRSPTRDRPGASSGRGSALASARRARRMSSPGGAKEEASTIVDDQLLLYARAPPRHLADAHYHCHLEGGPDRTPQPFTTHVGGTTQPSQERPGRGVRCRRVQ